ncbi:MAG: prolyl oligopeptidase family serine peptidase [Phycisphaerae bacterium]|jgi:prolyl oligopeptidase|nr:S9 family peptidase [Phycisphaerae bacterium]MCZ2401106.1 prolyl oligopeptidase family serine peptidase [Phycisphaerae bacterium]NUQ49146.1 S9 family peptidase [Phycisphaerae bacterium]
MRSQFHARPRRLAGPLLVAPLLAAVALAQSRGAVTYPPTRTADQVDEYHGVSVPDPYRWLENLDGAETKAWIDAQNRVTFDYLGNIGGREQIKQRLTQLWNYERYSEPFREGSRYFYTKNDGLQNHAVIYVMDGLSGEPRVLLNPNEWSQDGTVSLGGLSISDDGKLVAYAKSEGGSDWRTWYVRSIDTGEDLKDTVEWVKFSGAAWTNDHKGFYYSRYDQPQGDKLETINKFQKLYYHALGTPQSEDKLIYHRPDQPEWGFGGSVTEDGRYLVISIWQGTERKNRVYYQSLPASLAAAVPDPEKDVVRLLDGFDAEYGFVGNDGPVFYFRTDNGAPRYRLVAIDTRQPDPGQWQEIIPQSEDTLQDVSFVNNMFVASYLHDARSLVRIFDQSGKHVRDVDLPGIGTASGFGGKRHDTETFYTFRGFTNPGTIYRYDLVTGQSKVFRTLKVDFNPDDYETRQVFYSSKDGTRVPMFITHRKGLKLDGGNPTILYGYGGFNISLTPAFSVANLVWMELGGVFAQPNLRGGGEYGKAWHDAGRLHNKQNVFDDFIAAAEWLVANKYTRPEKLSIYGGSNGGLLVGACMIQRPDLFAAAVPAVGVMDMLRFNKFTIGWAWVSDYGSPEDPEAFRTLYAYSPLHNLKPGVKYPATLVLTGDHDDRVVPSHSFKFAARLQACQAGDAPVLIRVETRAGHGAGKSTALLIEEAADRLAFLTRVLGMEVAPPTAGTKQ